MLQFEQIKTEVLQCSEAQKRELHSLLSTLLNLGTGHQTGRISGLRPNRAAGPNGVSLEETTWNTLRGIAFPAAPPLAQLQRSNRSLHSRVVTTARDLERGIETLFPRLTQLQRSGVRTFFCHLAVSRLKDADELVSPGRVLEALVPVEELCDDRFPGYRVAGILTPIILQHLTQGKLKEISPDVRNKSTPQARPRLQR